MTAPHLRDIALHYHALGLNVTAIEAGAKGPAHAWKHWHSERQRVGDVNALPWAGYTVRKATKRHQPGDRVQIGGVGLISGVGGLRVFDIDPHKGEDRKPRAAVSDATIDQLISALRLPADYPWVWRSGSGAGWELAIVCDEAMPDGALTPDNRESGVYVGWAPEGADWHHVELRWQECQTVCPPSADGRGYAWRGAAPTDAPARLPLARIIAAFYDLAPPPPHTLGSVDRSVVEQIKGRFDLVRYAQHALGGETQQEGDEVRVLGHQGLLVHPEKGIWYLFGESVGGDCFDLVAYTRYRTTMRNLQGKSAEILALAAAYAGVSVPERERPLVNPTTGEVVEGLTAPPAKPVGPVEYVVKDWRAAGITAADLYRKEFAPLIWTVENILPEGACVLAGKPKSRKSWAALAAAVACATGDKLWGRLESRPGRVLYLDLESNTRRMRGRLFSMIGQRMSSITHLHIYDDWPRGEAGLVALEEWMQAYPDTVLIVIDVLADFRRPRDPREDPYTYDRETVQPINAFAERYRCSVLLLHHTRKAKADDVMDEISGSTGLPSAVATMWVLGRAPNGSGETVLTLRGRDLIHDEPLVLAWDDYANQFQVVGGAADALEGGERRAVLRVMADDAEWGPKEIAAELRKSVNAVQQLLKALSADGLIEKTGRGKYVRVLGRDQKDQNDQNRKNAHFTQNDDSDLDHQDQNQDQNRLRRPDAKNSPSDHSDRSFADDEDADVY